MCEWRREAARETGLDRFDVVVIGAGAAGMMCAIEAGRRGRRVLVLDHAMAAGEKIRISGGGRCNFTNLATAPDRFVSANPRFCISALSRYTPSDVIALLERHGVAWHEKTLGQLFCDGSATQVVDLLKAELAEAGATLRLATPVLGVQKSADGFRVSLQAGDVACEALVIATGGKSIPKMGATSFGYQLAEQFGVGVVETRPGLVPLTFEAALLERLKALAGVSLDVRVSCGKTRFDEAMLFTHRGLSGPAILQISSYWRPGEAIEVDMAPGVDVFEALVRARAENGRASTVTALSQWLPRRLAQLIAETVRADGNLAEASDSLLGAAGRRRKRLARHAGGVGRLSHRRSHPGRRRHPGSRLAHPGGQGRSRPLFHRRGGGRHRLARRLQFPMGLGQRLVRRPGGLTLRGVFQKVGERRSRLGARPLS